MKKKYFLCTLLFVFFNLLGNNAHNPSSKINISIEIVKENGKDYKGSSLGEKLLEYKNYRLLDLITEITNIPIQYFRISGDSKNPLVNFKATSTDKIEHERLVSAFITSLKEKLNIEVNRYKTIRDVKVLYCSDSKKMIMCEDNEIEYNSVTIINRTLKAKCIPTQKLIDIINEWFAEQLINDLDANAMYNFELHHSNSFEDLLAQLADSYGIYVKTEERQVKGLAIFFE